MQWCLNSKCCGKSPIWFLAHYKYLDTAESKTAPHIILATTCIKIKCIKVLIGRDCTIQQVKKRPTSIYDLWNVFTCRKPELNINDFQMQWQCTVSCQFATTTNKQQHSFLRADTVQYTRQGSHSWNNIKTNTEQCRYQSESVQEKQIKCLS